MVEVKTRNSDYFGDPQSFVTPKKIKLLVKAANEYIISNELNHIHSSRLELTIIYLIIIEVVLVILKDVLKIL